VTNDSFEQGAAKDVLSLGKTRGEPVAFADSSFMFH